MNAAVHTGSEKCGEDDGFAGSGVIEDGTPAHTFSLGVAE
jgi:hypothetical protein